MTSSDTLALPEAVLPHELAVRAWVERKGETRLLRQHEQLAPREAHQGR